MSDEDDFKENNYKPVPRSIKPGSIPIAVAGIIRDISGRKGLGNEWEEIDEEIQKEIREKWTKIIGDALDGRSVKI